MQRKRWGYVALTCAVIALGLASRKWPLFPPVLGKYPGDALYALMAFCALGAVSPSAATMRNAALALGFCYAVEASQLYHAPWIDSIRATTLGRLVLGAHFVWWDLLAYAVGAAAGGSGEFLLSRAAAGVRPRRQRGAGR